MTGEADLVACRGAALDLLDRAARPIGFAAAVGDDHYDAVWTRDAAITCLGVLATGDDRWHPTVERTLATVGSKASAVGQCPNTVWADGWWDFGEHGSVDATLWWCWAMLVARRAGVRVDEVSLVAALTWLRHRDTGGTGLVQSPGASDWMDSSVQRSGITLHANALWCQVVDLAEEDGIASGPGPAANDLRHALDVLLWPRADTDPADALAFLPADVRARGLPHPAAVAAHRGALVDERDHWASHRTWGHVVDVVDVLGNCLAVVAGLGEATQRERVIDGLERRDVARPHPSRTLDRIVVPGGADRMFDREADDNQDPRWRNRPFEYHNAASWPMVGGFHAMAARAAGHHDLAEELSLGLVDANREGEVFTFPEWRHGVSGEAGGARMQAWSAAAVLLATA